MSTPLIVYRKPKARKDSKLSGAISGSISRLIPLESMQKYSLEDHGYHDIVNSSSSARHEALTKAVKAYGKTAVIRKLNAVYVLNRNTNPDVAETVKKDESWVRVHITDAKRGSKRGSSKRGSKRVSRRGSRKNSKRSKK